MKELKQRLLERVSIDDETGCWEWGLSVFDYGYAKMSYKGKMLTAHRVAYETFIGQIPDGLLVCHHCDNPKCINPDHLFIGTHQDNSNDKIKKGRGVQGFAGKKHTEESRRKIGKANSKNQKGKGNSQYGTCWIYNEETQTNKKIPRFEFSSWKKHGWVRGRRMKSP